MSRSAVRRVRGIAWMLWLAQIVVAGVASALVWFREISIPHCSQSCDFELLSQTSVVFGVIAVGLVVVAGAGLVLVRSFSWSWAIPAVGIVVTLVGAIIANHLSDVAPRFV